MSGESAASRSLHAALSVLGALTGIASVLGMLTGAVWTVSTISADLAELGRRMGLVEAQLGALSSQVGSLREVVREIRTRAPSRHADVQSAPMPGAVGATPLVTQAGNGIN